MSLIAEEPATHAEGAAGTATGEPAAATPLGAIGGSAVDPDAELRVEKAKEFLSDAKVQGTPLWRRVQFLTNKGLSLKEIKQAFAAVGQPKEMHELEAAAKKKHPSTTSPNPGNANAMAQPQQPYQTAGRPFVQQPRGREAGGWSWKDYFIVGTLASAAMWGVSAVANEFFDISVTWKDDAAGGDGGSPKTKKAKKYAKELPPVPAASSQQVTDLETKVGALEADRDKIRDDVKKVEEKEEELAKLVKASESMLKSGVETGSKVARMEGKMRMQDRLVERVNNLEAAKKATDEEIENLKVAIQNLSRVGGGAGAGADADAQDAPTTSAVEDSFVDVKAPDSAAAPAEASTPEKSPKAASPKVGTSTVSAVSE